MKHTTVADYIAAAPREAQKNLLQLRALLRSVAPDAVEVIKWNAPAMEEARILFSYSAHRAHINFMPTGSALKPFMTELAGFRTGKDTIQLPHDRPLPRPLLRRIAEYRLQQVREEGALWMGARPAARKKRGS